MRESVVRLLGALLCVCIVGTVGLALYVAASINQYNAFWDGTPGGILLYGRPADERFSGPMARMVAQARKRGFEFTDPQLVQTDNLFNLWYIRWQRSLVIAVDIASQKRVLIDGLWMTEFNDNELDCVMAHELGHIIDYQSNRVGHPAFETLWCLRDQEFADSIGRMLCGYEPYQKVMRRHIRDRPMTVQQICGQRPLQP